MAIATKRKLDAGNYQLKDQVVAINRVTKVVKGGKNMSFAALVVVGDPSAGVVGYGSGKAKEVPQAIRKGIESAKKNLMRVNLSKTSIPHAVLGTFGSGRVLLKPGDNPLSGISGDLLDIALEVLPARVPGIELYGPMDSELRGGVVPFNLPGIHPHDVAQVLDRFGIAVRAGHHCTMPLHERLDLAATARASFQVYSTREDVDLLADGLVEVQKLFGS